MAKIPLEEISLTDLIQDPHNANVGTERGMKMLEDALNYNGAGRSILVDKFKRIIAGNKTHSGAIEVGMESGLLIKTTGETLVAVQRNDLDLLEDFRSRRMSIEDNRIGEVDLEWKPEELLALDAADPEHAIKQSFTEDEWQQIESIAQTALDIETTTEESDHEEKHVDCPNCGASFPRWQ